MSAAAMTNTDLEKLRAETCAQLFAAHANGSLQTSINNTLAGRYDEHTEDVSELRAEARAKLLAAAANGGLQRAFKKSSDSPCVPAQKPFLEGGPSPAGLIMTYKPTQKEQKQEEQKEQLEQKETWSRQSSTQAPSDLSDHGWSRQSSTEVSDISADPRIMQTSSGYPTEAVSDVSAKHTSSGYPSLS
eukprot:gnl/TRDRNA2_/TRDRNA2_197648_c0_seq1.p1 gnl/TRDRNA2_/TRDRNA2_197648_c0~~gnl/TRDRNA2_/TRDRNA2_197648_c0_seq1.p1  ORF type:complete len:211 (+),score=44.96 gnl/TRDRNA2_/TRDRNA2_197648_c0_seq1:72-635(+)